MVPPTRRRRTRSPVLIGLIALAVIVVLVFLGFSKDIPFTEPFEVNASFQSANSIRPGSPVRIAGVMFSASWRSLSSRSGMNPLASMLGSVENIKPICTSSVLSAATVCGPPASSGSKSSKRIP